MSKFGYKVEKYHTEEIKAEFGNELVYLYKNGQEGWELCAVRQPDNPMSIMPIYYYWKREIIDRLN